jgi:hypothetical protein
MAAPLGVMQIESEPGRIPWTAVQRWAEAHGYSEDRSTFLDKLLGEMDEEFLDWWRTRQRGAG